MIRRILVPTDFSEVAGDALRYAQHLARTFKAEQIKVIHVFTPQTAPDAVVLPPMNAMMDDRQKDLVTFVDKYAPDNEDLIKTDIQLGFAADEVVHLSEDCDLVVIGATGEAGLLEQVFGSVSSAVASRAHCPVLIVPAETNFRNYRNILYASNDISLSQTLVRRLMAFNELYRARVHFVHVNEGENDRYRGEREKLFASLFSGPDPEFAFEIGEVQAESVEEGLRQYVKDHQIDLVVLVARQRGFWDSFFRRSRTKQLILHPDTPLLIFHEDEDE